MMARGAHTPFAVYKRIPLGGPLSPTIPTRKEAMYDAYAEPWKYASTAPAPTAPTTTSAPAAPAPGGMASYKITWPAGVTLRSSPDPKDKIPGKVVAAHKVIHGVVVEKDGFTWLKRPDGWTTNFTYVPLKAPNGTVLAVKV